MPLNVVGELVNQHFFVCVCVYVCVAACYRSLQRSNVFYLLSQKVGSDGVRSHFTVAAI